MGTRRSDYVIVGVNIKDKFTGEYDWDSWEEFDEYSDRAKSGDIMYLIDGMSGSYFIVGEIIKRDKDGYEGLGCLEVDTDKWLNDERNERIKKHILDHFGIDGCEVKLYVLTHWT